MKRILMTAFLTTLSVSQVYAQRNRVHVNIGIGSGVGVGVGVNINGGQITEPNGNTIRIVGSSRLNESIGTVERYRPAQQYLCGVEQVKLQMLGDGAKVTHFSIAYGNGMIEQIPVRNDFNAHSESEWKQLKVKPGGCLKAFQVVGKSDDHNRRDNNQWDPDSQARVIAFGNNLRLGSMENPQNPYQQIVGLTETVLRANYSNNVEKFPAVCGLDAVRIKVLMDDATISNVRVYMVDKNNVYSQQNLNFPSHFPRNTQSEWVYLKQSTANNGDQCVYAVDVVGSSDIGWRNDRVPTKIKVEGLKLKNQ